MTLGELNSLFVQLTYIARVSIKLVKQIFLSNYWLAPNSTRWLITVQGYALKELLIKTFKTQIKHIKNKLQ